MADAPLTPPAGGAPVPSPSPVAAPSPAPSSGDATTTPAPTPSPAPAPTPDELHPAGPTPEQAAQEQTPVPAPLAVSDDLAASAQPVAPVAGRVDNTTRRSDADPLQGHFVEIDLSHAGVSEEIRDQGITYGVYLEPAEVGEDGYPVTALVRARDATNALIVVPFEALSPSDAGHR